MAKELRLPFLTEYQPDVLAQKKVKVGRDKTTGVLEIAKHHDLTGLEFDWLDKAREEEQIKNSNVLTAEFVDSVAKKYDIEVTEVWQSVTRIEKAAIEAQANEESDWIAILQKELACPLQDYIEYSERLKTYARREKYLKAALILKFRVDSEITIEDVKNPDIVPPGLVDCLALFCEEEMARIDSADQNIPDPITDKQIKNLPSSAESPSESQETTGRKSTGKSKNTGEVTKGSTRKTLASNLST